MTAPNPTPAPRFVVQCAKGKGWKTLVMDDQQPAAERAFREVVKVNPRGFFRLIRLDDKPDAEVEGQEFSWKLLSLHDPRKDRPPPNAAGNPAPPAKHVGIKRTATGHPAAGRTTTERIGIPFRLYGLALIIGALLAVAAYLRFGPA